MNHYRTQNVIFTFVVALLGVQPVHGDVRLPSLVGNHMVLQRNREVPIWGWADPGEKVELSVSWDAQPRTAVADNEGKWSIRAKTPDAGGPYQITIVGKNRIALQNVLIGEVWLAAGQSNMEFGVELTSNAEQEMAAANYPDIRLFKVPRRYAGDPQDDCEGKWEVCTPKTVYGFTGVGYYFGREIHKELVVPVGVIHCAWGGTWAEACISMPTLSQRLDLPKIKDRYERRDICEFFTPDSLGYPKALEAYEEQMKRWPSEAAAAKRDGKPVPPEPRKPFDPMHRNSPATLYNGMIAPIIPYAIRGAIWYQGEWNAAQGFEYRKTLSALIDSWRDGWGQGDFPFYYVQVAPYAGYALPESAADLRESQLITSLSVPNTGMAPTLDIGESGDIHPLNKQDVGRRLARWALSQDYGHTLAHSGPIFKSMKTEGGTVRLFFTNAVGGLTDRGTTLAQFKIAGADRIFFDAEATIDCDTAVVRSDRVSDPVAVRYAWSNDAKASLFDQAGLPASPFRTDNWPLTTENRD